MQGRSRGKQVDSRTSFWGLFCSAKVQLDSTVSSSDMGHNKTYNYYGIHGVVIPLDVPIVVGCFELTEVTEKTFLKNKPPM
jgi:hypothetical protein